MLRLRKVAITGGLASGKSSVGRFLKELGAYVVSADEIVHQLLNPTTNLGHQIINLLGHDVVKNGQFDRSAIAAKVFKDPQLLHSYEQIVHPTVRAETQRQYKLAQEQQPREPYKLFVAEIPLLFESGDTAFYDAIIVVDTDPKIARERFIQATGHTAEEFARRMQRQLSPSEKLQKADYILHNDGDLTELKNQVTKLYNTLISSE